MISKPAIGPEVASQPQNVSRCQHSLEAENLSDNPLGGRPHRVEIASPKILDEVKREEIRCQSPPTFLAPSIQNESDLGSGDGAMPAPPASRGQLCRKYRRETRNVTFCVLGPVFHDQVVWAQEAQNSWFTGAATEMQAPN